jgi:hypothetical protein
MMGVKNKAAFLSCSLPLIFLLGVPVKAGQFEALCGGVKCSIVVNQTEITSPFGTIPASRVSYWGNTGESKTSVGTGVATTILFGGVGLLGFLAKTHNYNFYINGFDASGKKLFMEFSFKNDKPAKLLMQELRMYTGLGMGQTRTIEEIQAAESGKPVSPGPLQAAPVEKMDALPAGAKKAR